MMCRVCVSGVATYVSLGTVPTQGLKQQRRLFRHAAHTVWHTVTRGRASAGSAH